MLAGFLEYILCANAVKEAKNLGAIFILDDSFGSGDHVQELFLHISSNPIHYPLPQFWLFKLQSFDLSVVLIKLLLGQVLTCPASHQSSVLSFAVTTDEAGQELIRPAFFPGKKKSVKAWLQIIALK